MTNGLESKNKETSPVVVHVEDEDDEKGIGYQSITITIALILLILIVLFFMGGHLSDWFGSVTQGAANLGGQISGAVGGFFQWGRGLLGTGTTVSAEDKLLEEMYSYTEFIITATNTQKNYLALLEERKGNIAVYNVKEVGTSESITEDVFGPNANALFNTLLTVKVYIPIELMSRLEKLRAGQSLKLESENYWASITAEGIGIDNRATYKMEIRKKT